MSKIIIFDTETTGIITGKEPHNWWTPENWCNYPYILTMAWVVIDLDVIKQQDLNANIVSFLNFTHDISNVEYKHGVALKKHYYKIKPLDEYGNRVIAHPKALEANGLNLDELMISGVPIQQVLQEFMNDCKTCDLIVGHNIVKFDIPLTIVNAQRFGVSGYQKSVLKTNEDGTTETIDDRTMYLSIPKNKFDTMRDERIMKWVDAHMKNGRLKFPNLTELHIKCFGTGFDAHNALYDVQADMCCYFKMLELGIIT